MKEFVALDRRGKGMAGAWETSAVQCDPIHKDPFDRILVAQAMAEGITLLTTDSLVAKYPGQCARFE